MKVNLIKKDDPNENWKKRNGGEKRKLSSFGVAAELGKKYTYFNEGTMKIMASLVPDEVIYNISDYSKREFDACLMIGDVSGWYFTNNLKYYIFCIQALPKICIGID